MVSITSIENFHSFKTKEYFAIKKHNEKINQTNNQAIQENV